LRHPDRFRRASADRAQELKRKEAAITSRPRSLLQLIFVITADDERPLAGLLSFAVLSRALPSQGTSYRLDKVRIIAQNFSDEIHESFRLFNGKPLQGGLNLRLCHFQT
jgi:hypothetical protein